MADKGAAPAGAGAPTGADGKAAIPSKDDIMKIKAQKKMQQQQEEVDQVIGIMHKNVEQVWVNIKMLKCVPCNVIYILFLI